MLLNPVGYIGHFNDVKGVDLLASAFSSLVRSGRDVNLALAWSGQGDPRPMAGRHSACLLRLDPCPACVTGDRSAPASDARTASPTVTAR